MNFYGHFKAIDDNTVFGGIFELCSAKGRWNSGMGNNYANSPDNSSGVSSASSGGSMGATMRITSNESPSLNGGYRVLNSNITLDLYSDEGWSIEIDARKAPAKNLQCRSCP